ncbi:ENR1 protein, partial [Indicator maculatus]|nr:ENR1 protein [Indicator maculatus]
KGLGLPLVGKNLFTDLAEKVAENLNVTSCRVCGGLLMSEEWPWKGSSLDLYHIIKWNHSVTSGEEERPREWALTSDTTGAECLEQKG